MLAGCLLVAGCGGGYSPAGPFRDLPRGAPPQVGPPTSSAPVPLLPGPSTPGSSDPRAGDPNVVATGLTVPTGLVVLPDGTAVVGERNSGRLLHVFPDHSPTRELMTVPGIGTGAGGGLLGLAVSPTFAQDGLFYAYVSTATDNRVIRFPLGGTPNPVLTGIPRGPAHNGGGLLFGADGTLYVGTGDTGDPALAADPASLAGKVLAVDVFGRPRGAGPVYTRGLRNVTALCSGGNGRVYATDDAAPGPDAFELLTAGGTAGPAGPPPVLSVPQAEAGLAGCAVSGPYVFLGALAGRKVVLARLDGSGKREGPPTDFLAGRYGRLRTVVVDPSGALWITTSNRDGAGAPAAGDDRVLRVLPPASAANSPL